METLQQFKERTSFIKGGNLQSELITNQKLADKIDEYGNMKVFYGDTVVFLLPNEVKQMLLKRQDILYNQFGVFLAQRIDEQNFHMTLHDLSNSNNIELIKDEIQDNKEKCIELLKFINMREHEVIPMKTSFVCNMVNTSIVLGVQPADEISHQRLMSLYELFNDVHELSYPLTPHITLAYFKNLQMGYDDICALRNIFNQLNEYSIEFDLNVDMLKYQRFSSMNDYVSY